jgi:hypothetical protein
MGQGIVPTADNFGVMGLPPSHPELLDHLALSFMENGWSVKKLIKQILLSRAYQMSSTHDAKNYALDPDNKHRWRMDQRRLDAEAIRDAMLAVSGTLDLYPIDGSPIARVSEGRFGLLQLLSQFTSQPYPYRSIYLPIIRDQIPEFLSVFDFPDASLVNGQRDTTNVPSQSLFLMNNPQAAPSLLKLWESNVPMSDWEKEYKMSILELEKQGLIAKIDNDKSLANYRNAMAGLNKQKMEEASKFDPKVKILADSYNNLGVRITTLVGSHKGDQKAIAKDEILKKFIKEHETFAKDLHQILETLSISNIPLEALTKTMLVYSKDGILKWKKSLDKINEKYKFITVIKGELESKNDIFIVKSKTIRDGLAQLSRIVDRSATQRDAILNINNESINPYNLKFAFVDILDKIRDLAGIGNNISHFYSNELLLKSSLYLDKIINSINGTLFSYSIAEGQVEINEGDNYAKETSKMTKAEFELYSFSIKFPFVFSEMFFTLFFIHSSSKTISFFVISAMCE